MAIKYEFIYIGTREVRNLLNQYINRKQVDEIRRKEDYQRAAEPLRLLILLMNPLRALTRTNASGEYFLTRADPTSIFKFAIGELGEFICKLGKRFITWLTFDMK